MANKYVVGILGNNLDITTNFVENIINNTPAKKDQDHIKMNIVVNENLLNKKTEEIIDIAKKMEEIDSTCLCLCFECDKHLYNSLKNNINIPVLNTTFNGSEEVIINNILKTFKSKGDF